MIGLSHAQLKVVMSATADAPVEKRSQFLERTAAMLGVRGQGRERSRSVRPARGVSSGNVRFTPSVLALCSPRVHSGPIHLTKTAPHSHWPGRRRRFSVSCYPWRYPAPEPIGAFVLSL